jgi:hypothetical protein
MRKSSLKIEKIQPLQILKQNVGQVTRKSFLNIQLDSSHLPDRASFNELNIVGKSREIKSKTGKGLLSIADLTKSRDASASKSKFFETLQLSGENQETKKSISFFYNRRDSLPVLNSLYIRQNFNDYGFFPKKKLKNGHIIEINEAEIKKFPKYFTLIFQNSEFQVKEMPTQEINETKTVIVDFFRAKTIKDVEVAKPVSSVIKNFQKNVKIICAKQNRVIPSFKNIPEKLLVNPKKKKKNKMKYITKWLKIIESLLEGESLEEVF